MPRGGGKGSGKGGAKPQFKRVIPKFLQQYETILTGPKPKKTEEHSVGGGDDLATGGGRSGGAQGAFDDYDDEEVVALEEYRKRHPPAKTDKDEVRRRARELAKSIVYGQEPLPPGEGAGTGDRANTGDVGGAGGGETPTEDPQKYMDSSGKLKFNRPTAAGPRVGEAAAGQGARAAFDHKGRSRATGGRERKSKRAKLAKLDNKMLLSFGDDS